MSSATLVNRGTNAAFGYQALNGGITTAQDNVAFGYNALAGTTTQAAYLREIAFGSGALAKGGTAADYEGPGMAFGADAGGSANLYGYMDVAFGYQAVQSNTMSGANGRPCAHIGFGWRALKSNINGCNETAIGAAALSAANMGNYNSGVGYNALSQTTGHDNVAIGAQALAVSTSGNQNTAVGMNALAANTTANDNTALGSGALAANTTGINNAAMGAGALSVNTTGSNNIAVGYNTGPTTNNLSNTICIGNGAQVSSSGTAQIGNASVTMIGGQVLWNGASDLRLKKDIRDADLGLDFIMALHPVSYRLINGNGRLDYGFIAQEVEAALAYDGKTRVANMVTQKDDEIKTYQLRHADIIAPLVKAVQQQEEAAELRTKDIGSMKADLLDVQEMIARLKEHRP
jgi:hypothetical protein